MHLIYIDKSTFHFDTNKTGISLLSRSSVPFPVVSDVPKRYRDTFNLPGYLTMSSVPSVSTLPLEILQSIASLLPVGAIIHLSFTCRRLRSIVGLPIGVQSAGLLGSRSKLHRLGQHGVRSPCGAVDCTDVEMRCRKGEVPVDGGNVGDEVRRDSGDDVDDVSRAAGATDPSPVVSTIQKG
ncbi:hypothetical protein M427DRAFT_354386 [Gonapodya prolifera JEL478]|uniref:F-box domain-containing protein n=1 Tax=Gonapodya prolifera (strain JEL478) TaxID=1344416 RepID=A0A139AB81_GONPJ|nr:hypothetical protein M427DRAFT_354386 [Gonapodya prolifera JEL478]|eukprot:KXS14082.1 hypothetical protein M427DRAFT_354386 [Gonapodya prolifera JEL478]